MNHLLIESLRVGNGLIAVGIVLAFGMAALTVPVPTTVIPPVAVGLGAAVGLAVAILLCGMTALLLDISDRLPSGAVAASPSRGAIAAAPTPAVNAVAANQNGSSPEAEVLPQELQQMLENGRFADYHVERAKLAFAAGDKKTARQQVLAAMAHEPHHATARQLRAEIRAAR